MVYPSLLICVSIGVLGAMFGFVLPRFEGLFETLDAPLPPSTKIMMGISAWLKDWWFLAIGGAIAAAGGTKVYLSTPSGRFALHRTRPAAVRKIVRRSPPPASPACSASCSRQVLFRSLQLTRDATAPVLLVIRDAEDCVVRGDNVSTAFAQAPDPQAVVEAAVRREDR